VAGRRRHDGAVTVDEDVAQRVGDRGVADVVAIDRDAGTAEDQVRAGGPQARRDEVEGRLEVERVVGVHDAEAVEVRAVADDVVLAEPAEDRIVAAARLDVVVAVAGVVVALAVGRVDPQRLGVHLGAVTPRPHARAVRAVEEDRAVRQQVRVGVAVGGRAMRRGGHRLVVVLGEDQAVDVGVTHDDVVAQFAEDLVAARATGEVIAPPEFGVVRLDVVGVVEEGDGVLLDAGGVVLPRLGDEDVAVGAVRDRRAVDEGAGQGAHPRVEEVGAPAALGVVAGDGIVAGAAVDDVPRVEGAGDVGAADEEVVVLLAVDDVRALLTEHDVVTLAGEDEIVVAVGAEREHVGGLEIVGAAEVHADAVGGVVRVVRSALAADPAVVAEDQVGAGEPDDDVVAPAPEQHVRVRAGGHGVVAVVAVSEADRLDDADRELVDRVDRGGDDAGLSHGGQAAVVAECDVPAFCCPGADGVVGGATDDDVVACAGGDRICAAECRGVRVRPDAVDVTGGVGGVAALGVAGVLEDRQVADQVVHEPVVAKHDGVEVQRARGEVLAVVRGDRVAVAAAEHHVPTDAGPDGVRTAVLGDREVGRGCGVLIRHVALDELEDGDRVVVGGVVRASRARDDAVGVVRLQAGDSAVVTEHDVLAVGGVDDVVVDAAEHEVVARPGRDRVCTTEALEPRGDVVEADRARVREVGGAGLERRDPVQEPVVTEHHIVRVQHRHLGRDVLSLVRHDDVTRGATDHDVTAHTRFNGVQVPILR